MTGSIITPQNDDMGIIPQTNYCGQIGSSDKNFYRMYTKSIYADHIYKQGTDIDSRYASATDINNGTAYCTLYSETAFTLNTQSGTTGKIFKSSTGISLKSSIVNGSNWYFIPLGQGIKCSAGSVLGFIQNLYRTISSNATIATATVFLFNYGNTNVNITTNSSLQFLITGHKE